MYVYVYTVYIYIYIYICIERERERKRETDRERCLEDDGDGGMLRCHVGADRADLKGATARRRGAFKVRPEVLL